MSEKVLQAAVVDLATRLGWLSYHTLFSRGSESGFPDLVLARPPRIVFAELKTEKGRVAPAQARWAHALRASAAEVYLWRPADWFAGTIERTLR